MATSHGERAALPGAPRGITVGAVPFVDPEHVLLIRQFRHLARSDSWELPGGGGQAQRELREEGGYRAGRLTFLTRFQPSNAYLDETAYCYIGEDLCPIPSPPTTTSSSSAG